MRPDLLTIGVLLLALAVGILMWHVSRLTDLVDRLGRALASDAYCLRQLGDRLAAAERMLARRVLGRAFRFNRPSEEGEEARCN